MKTWEVAGIFLMMVIVVVLGIYFPRRRHGKRIDPLSEAAEEMRRRGLKIHVDYALCTIRDSTYSYEETVAHGRIAAGNILGGNEMNNVQMRTEGQLLVEYPYSAPDGSEHIYQLIIYGMTRDNFDMRFIANDIYMYIDPRDDKVCMLDMGKPADMGTA